MIRMRAIRLAGCVAAVILGGALEGRAIQSTPDPAAWRAQVEADWLRQDALRTTPAAAGAVRPEQDAAGAVDGVKNGLWGFHTAFEKDPWWQADLGRSESLDRVRVFNRTDQGTAARTRGIRVLVSEDGRQFRLAYQHDGPVFLGAPDGKPLEARLGGVTGRYVRLALEGTSYFHLDEVEIFAKGSVSNIALGRPATQSSVSEWSARHDRPAASGHPMALVLERGLKLAASQRALGADVAVQEARLRAAAREFEALPASAPEDARRALYFRARWAVRAMALGNPLLNFESLLFVKRAPGTFPHMSDQHYGWWSRPGGGLCRLDGFKTASPSARLLTSDLPPGSVDGADLSYDGRRVLFGYCRFDARTADMDKSVKSALPEDIFYNLYEMNADGTGRRRITRGRYDDFGARYLPNGEIVFVSTRKGVALQCTQAGSDATRLSDQPDSYVRCGGDNYRPVPVFTLHLMDAQGANIRPFSSFENFEWPPTVAADGRVIYTRWDYIDRFNGHFFSLWSAGQDGGNAQLVYGNYTVKPQVVVEARSIPGSSKMVFTASAHHSITGGSLCLLDRPKGLEEEAPLTRLTPEVCFPETEGSPSHYYANPWPLSEEYFLAGWADTKLPPHQRVGDARNSTNAMGIYLYDAFGNLELLHRDPEISSVCPIPLAPRPRPPVQTPAADWAGPQEGRFLVQDIYQGLPGVARGSIQSIRLVAVPPKVQPHMNNPQLGVSAEDPGKYVLGLVPVEADGSAYFRVPSGVPLFFQALDRRGVSVQTMRSLSYVQPGQTLACVGCHEHRDVAPPPNRTVLAAAREPSRFRPGPEGSWPLRFDRLVQPVLDQHCVSCHRPGAPDPEGARLNLTAAAAYQSLMSFGGEDLKKAAFERDRSIAGTGTAATSKLWALLTKEGGHAKVTLPPESLDRLATWMDTYAQRAGHYSPQQEKELEAFRVRLAGLIDTAPGPQKAP